MSQPFKAHLPMCSILQMASARKKKVTLQYCNYPPKDAKQLFSLIEHVPNYANGSEKPFCALSHLEEMEIDLETGTAQITNL